MVYPQKAKFTYPFLHVKIMHGQRDKTAARSTRAAVLSELGDVAPSTAHVTCHGAVKYLDRTLDPRVGRLVG